LQTTSRDRQAQKLILAALLLLLMAWWALSYHIGEFRGDGSTDSGVLSFVRPSFPRYHISLGQLALSERGAHEFRFRGLPDERMTLMLYVQGKTYFQGLGTADELVHVDSCRGRNHWTTAQLKLRRECMEKESNRPHLAQKTPEFRCRARNICLPGHEVRGVAVRACLSCRAFWSRASVIHVQGAIS
jgi:hypothetical protein